MSNSKPNRYFRTAFRRENVIKVFLFDICMKLWSYPRLILEIFIRRNFGLRYFSVSSAFGALVVLILIPLVAHRISHFSSGYGNRPNFWLKYTSWYLFVIACGYYSWKRWIEIQYSPSTFDFKKFSLYSGDINRKFFEFTAFGVPTARTVETVYEPGLFFACGLLMAVIGQPIGYLIMVSAVFYSLSYFAAYKKGDDFILDLIDEKIMNEEYRSAFIDDLMGHQTRGVRFYMRKPSSADLREDLEDSFMVNATDEELFTYAE